MAVGALVKPEGDTQYRPKTRGQLVDLSEQDARNLIAAGTARLVDQHVAADTEERQPTGGVIDLDDPNTTIKELRQFADDRRIRLKGARTRPEILGMIRAALVDPEAGNAIGAAMISPPVAETHPLVNPAAAEPGGPAAPTQPGEPPPLRPGVIDLGPGTERGDDNAV